jgi:hypothetical protein
MQKKKTSISSALCIPALTNSDFLLTLSTETPKLTKDKQSTSHERAS